MAARLASAGWLAIAPHMFHRTGDPKFGYDDFSVIAEHMMALTPDTIADDVGVALDHAESAGFAAPATGIVGFCMGGTVAMWTATTRPLGAAVTFYGGGVAASRFGLPTLIDAAPHFRRHGWASTAISTRASRSTTSNSCVKRQRSRSSRRSWAYPDADHGFNCDRRASYHADSATDAWQRMLAWFDTYIAKPT